MMKRLFPRRITAFTLVEMIVVLAIISLLVTLGLPSMQSALLKARSVKCAANLRGIGIAASLAAADNNNKYPEINQAAAPIYPTTDPNATNLVGALGPYGITPVSTQCPIDMTMNPTAFKQYGSSYEWNPAFDDEVTTDPVIFITTTLAIPVNSYRVRLCTDFNPIHRGRSNALYGDGHVTAH